MAYFSVHTHSKYSAKDGMTPVSQLVSKAVSLEHEALGLTDHGMMAGVFELYKECKAADIKPYPGVEAYLVDDHTNKAAKRYHVGLLALDYEGYKTLVKLVSQSFTRPHFHSKPRIDFADLASLSGGPSDHLALTTGCYFGLVVQALVQHGRERAEAVARMYASWFPHTFVEIQHHHTDHTDSEWTDTSIAVELHDIANVLGLPTIITQDCHYCDQKEAPLHTMMKRLTIFSKDTDAGDVGFPGDSYHMAGSAFIKSHFDDPLLRPVWNEALGSYPHLLGLHNLSIPALDNYQFRMPDIAKRPDTELRKRAQKKLDELGDKPVRYQKRLDEELGVIKDTGFANYFLMTEEIVSYCWDHNIVVQARGSANGSLVCFLLGITSEDPIKWEIRFDGFLTRDRSKPPDIDLDIEKGRRGEVIEWMSKRFLNVNIGTWGRLGINEEKETSSLYIQYVSALRREMGEDAFKKAYAGMKPWDVAKANPEDDALLRELADMEVYSKHGAHAAGFVLDDGTGLLFEVVPTMLIASSDSTVTQWPMDDLEDSGFVKIDLLGLTTLSSTHRTLEMMGESWDYYRHIPDNDKDVLREISRGHADNGTFQLEGHTTARGVRQMRPRTTKEVIAAMALFRPAMIASGYVDQYLRNREVPRSITYVADVTEKHLKPTYGVALYQEQIIAICRDLGMTSEDVQRLVKAIKVKHGKGGYSEKSEAAFNIVYEAFMDACSDSGLSSRQGDDIFDLIVGFNRYGFKKAHAVPYGLLAYRTSWLKHHYPAEFHAALLETFSWADPKKEAMYEQETRRVANELRNQGLPSMSIADPDVNTSGILWTLDRETNRLRRGLLSIKGVGERAAAEIAASAPYESVDEMIAKLPAKVVTGGKNWNRFGELSGTYKTLLESHALDSLVTAEQLEQKKPKIKKPTKVVRKVHQGVLDLEGA